MLKTIGSITAIATLALLTACGADKTAEAGSDAGLGSTAQSDVTIPAAGGGTMRVQEGVSQDATLPQGFGKPAGAKMLRATNMDGGPGIGTITGAEMEVPGTVEAATAFCKSEFARIGASIDADVSSEGNAVLSGKAANGDRLMVSVRQGDTPGTAVVSVTNTGRSK